MATAPDLEAANDVGEPKGMDDSELAALLAAHESRAIGYYNSEIADEQAKAINYYYGIMDDVPVLDGCSAVVDHTVSVMVDNALAAVLKPFVSADEVVSFQPRGPEDTAQAEQATEYVNYVIQCDNPGFLILHNWFKDALLTKIGVIKVWWEDQSKSGVQAMPADAMQLEAARKSPDYLGEQDNGDGTFTVQIQQTQPDGRVRIEAVPPEEFLISPFARSVEESSYVAHRPSNYTRSDVLELAVGMGMTYEDALAIVDDLPAWAPGQNEESRQQARYRDEDRWSQGDTGMADRSRDIIGVIDEYVRCDYDGDGIAELRRVIRVSDTILFNEPAEEAPFALLCPCPMPHKVYGRALADQAMEGQKVSTAVLRQTLDNLYKSNNPRPIVPNAAVDPATYDDLGETAPGAAIRVKAGGQLDWLVVPFTANQSFPMLEYVALQTEERTGIQRKGNGLNPETLKKNSPDTATQASIDENSRNERAEMIARIFAETGVKRLFKLILGLLVRHQPKERVVRLRNTWVEMDPRGWNPEMDVSISVGLGVGNKSEQIGQAQTVLQGMERLAATPYAFLIQPQHVHTAMKRLYTAAGIKDVDNYIADPNQVEAPEPEPDPKVAEAQAKMQIDQARLQHDQQMGAVKLQLEQQANQAKLQAQAAIEGAKMQLEQAKAANQAMLEQQRQAFEQQLAGARADFEARLALAESRAELELERERLAMQREQGEAKIDSDREVALSKERKGGKLDK